MSEELINKYRPKTFDEVVGHKLQVQALQEAVKRKSARTFLFTGPSGVGKTTLARIVASEAGCGPDEVHEIDAAVNTGVDDMRALEPLLRYRPIGRDHDGKLASRAIIVDECHALSKQAFQSLLKALEEPPPWLYWMLCTTEPNRVLPTIKTRSFAVDLKPVQDKLLSLLLSDIAKKEKLGAKSDVIEVCVEAAEGSPRQAISNLTVCANAKTATEAEELLQRAAKSVESVDLARALVRRSSWGETCALIQKLKETNPESVRHVVRAYVTAVALGARNGKDAVNALEILEAFSEPFYSSDGMSPLVRACGRVIYGQDNG